MKEMRLAGIDTIEAGNAFLSAFMEQYNARFAKPPFDDRDVHRALTGHDDLDDTFAWEEEHGVRQPDAAVRPGAVHAGLDADQPAARPQARDGGRLSRRTAGDPPQRHRSVLSHFRQASAGQSGRDVENKRLGILAYIAEQQKELDMSRSAKAPRRRGQKNHMFKVG